MASKPQTVANVTEWGRVGIVAGGGKVPVFVADALRQKGADPFIAMIAGEADPLLEDYDHEAISVAAIGQLVSALKKANVSTVCIVGSVSRRPGWNEFRPDKTVLRMLPRIVRNLSAGDDAILSAIVDMLEEDGFAVVGTDALAPDLLASHGLLAGKAPGRAQHQAIQLGMEAARLLGKLDAGQGVIVSGKRIVALEGAEGTDAMITRVAELKASGRLANRRGGVLVKLAKPGQELRTDLPTIGVTTVENAARAKLAGIAVEAERALIVERAKVIEAANRAGLFLLGVDGQN